MHRRCIRQLLCRTYSTTTEGLSSRLHKPSNVQSSNSQLKKYNGLLQQHFSKRNWSTVFLLAGMMKHHRVTPDATTYMVLLNTCYSAREIRAAEAVWEDIDATGTVLDQAMYDGLLSNPHLNPGQVRSIILHMEKRGILPGIATFNAQLRHIIKSQRNVPLLLLYFWKVVRLSGPPDVAMMNSIIKIICSFSHPRLACDIVDWYEKSCPRRVGTEAWIHILNAASHRQWYEGTKRAWDIIMSFKATPDEGLCLQVANVAARAGDSAFVSAVLEALSQKGIRWEEWHFAPLVEAFARSSNIQEAFSVIAIIRSAGVNPSPGSGNIILAQMQKDPELLEQAWNCVDALKLEEQPIDIVVLHILLSGALAQRDLQRAIALFQNFESYGHKPDLHTFNLLLKACVEMDQIDLGKGLAQAMDQAGILPSDESYEHLIALSLAQQSTFDRAFNYLREMDDKNVFVSNRLYELLVDRLIDAGDRRWKVAHQTLLERGYRLSRSVHRKVHNLQWEEAQVEKQRQLQENLAQSMDNAHNAIHALGNTRMGQEDQDYIDSGGLR